ncbi:hypothetical protein KAFR_0D04440 [Kazachstania africana CBS 2517]|uniref:FYVE-type domain-containing protein n=1 Tax=Kazachstania africana (strain ATCC 22294 / BCRC 22015 / CBS 2517 / CECT 1963 / NBRC 1671 / NRRL Y-8276) TaxID=1071382 RepID=H2AUP2_KAZAF|nr:hypothetical protein KAFR_0D04440 [Kazachstania africana CBS 2517]CCF58092.1 hypothetical protein KAFR_0D04440 [Kazachstania africana CBS 2517]
MTENEGTIKLDNLLCPICFKNFNNLQKLNAHLDIDHGFIDESVGSRTSSLPESRTDTRLHQKKQIKRDHWVKYVPNSSLCSHCNRLLSKSTRPLNCRKCGNIFCKMHCTNIVKLNIDAKYDPINGKWFHCCHDCYTSKPGYKDFGASADLTDDYISLRNSRREDRSLQKLQLENRLVHLADGLIRVNKKYKGKPYYAFKRRNDISDLERSITPWKEDKHVSRCHICQQPFGLLSRKHHCRLCGSIVCDSISRRCSNQVLLYFLQEVTLDLPYQEHITKKEQMEMPDMSVRLCSRCVNIVYSSRKIEQEKKESLSMLLSKYHSMSTVVKVIEGTLPTFEELLQKTETTKTEKTVPNSNDILSLAKLREKLLRSFTTYTVLTKQLLVIEPTNRTEKSIQDSIKIVSAEFINDKLLPLKNIPAVLSPDKYAKEQSDIPQVKQFSEIMNNLSVKEVKAYREELMVLKEQSFLIESMVENAKALRKFDEVNTLSANLKELSLRSSEIQKLLGENGFE